ncbi:thiamine-phosphate kinase [Microbacterium oleivorans]|uniref:Thiamine-monophosphate kinase n=1 Tax=Microbacterium oleivorans TaxID=273677 RepID=A0A7D5F509_9MICO|nr:thiamine-phosphate kinase [Microbacterium oleivorans]QLD10333.1 thiamine-phosphate kinase [Microbacterium oleivorans]
MSDPSRATPVGEMTEEEVLRRILARLGPADVEVGPGDDAAVLALADPRVVVTTDTLVHGPDFRLAWSSGLDLGAKSAAVNLADIAAMGARPVALFVALAMPEDTTIGFVDDLATGLREACDELAPGCRVAGGDLTVSTTLTIAVTAVGELEPGRRPVLRSGARAGDAVAIAGEVGLAAAGLQILFSRFRDGAGEPVPVAVDTLTAIERGAVAGQLRPRPPIAAGPVAAAAGATAMMDVSDGLVRDARRMARASGVTIDLHRSTLGEDSERALHGGEDHALLATFPSDAPLPAGFRVIGTVGEAGPEPLTVDGRGEGAVGGWDPYRDWDGGGG